jgi:hypothetical protein
MLLVIGITVGLNKLVTTVPTQIDSIATVVLDLPAEIKPEWKGLTADQIIDKYKKGQIRREFPKQFLDETIETIDEIAKTGDGAARKAMKLLTNKRFDKDDNRK